MYKGVIAQAIGEQEFKKCSKCGISKPQGEIISEINPSAGKVTDFCKVCWAVQKAEAKSEEIDEAVAELQGELEGRK